MKKVKKFIPVVLFLFLCPILLIAQDNTVTQIKPFSIGLEIGYSANFMSGSAKNGINKMIEGFEDSQLENLNFKGTKTPVLSPVLGVYLDYQFKERLSFRAGIQCTRRGYNIRIDGEEKDDEFQFDQKFTYKEKLRLTTIEIPFSALFMQSKQLYFQGGFLVGMSISNSAKIKVSMVRKVIINGELSQELSEPMTNTSIDLRETVKNPYLGLFASVGYNIYPNLFLKLTVLRTSTYIVLEYGNLSDTSINVVLNYSLFNF